MIYGFCRKRFETIPCNLLVFDCFYFQKNMEEIKHKNYFEAAGFSMWPFIKQEDRIIAEEVNAEELFPGEVIVYRSESKLVCHRLVSKKKTKEGCFFLTRGDYLPSWNTERVTKGQIVGRVCGVVRNGRLISLKNRCWFFLGKIIIVFFPFPVFLFVNIRKVFKK